jgi:cytochrome c-type biogenesis protein CcmH
MALWFVFSLMTMIAAFAVLWPLSRPALERVSGGEVAIYRDQLAEVDRDLAHGVIGRAEADAARIEVSRRLLAADRSEQERAYTSSTGLRRAVAAVALVALPLLSTGLYLRLGSPGAIDLPVPTRQSATVENASLEQLVAQVEQHLEKAPPDGRGWEVLAPVLLKLGRYDDAVRAYRNALSYNIETAARHSNLGEALGAAAGGVITAEAKAEFERARALDPTDAKARYFLGLAAEQDGRRDEAAAIWRDLLSSAPPDAPWRAGVEQALAGVTGEPAPDIGDQDMVAARSMTEQQRAAFVRGMVERLATRLKQDGHDLKGWLRLVRAYMVLGERDKAAAAAADARAAIGGDAAGLAELNDQLRQFDVGG